ncbi:AAA family ATPase [Streptomyces sp. NPDC002619]|uniref:helix-turn-helix transcriptional regulator n=1 Tax=Streptomyces sp. NPDC002619 TaxID=3364655 RepID=UPI0036CC2EA7
MTLVGRTAAIRTLDESLTDCIEGRLRTVLVEGPTGCGKSALVHVVVERAAAAGAVVLCATGFSAERRTPYGVLRQLAGGHRGLTLPQGAVECGPRIEDMQAFCTELREVSEGTPVVLCVDDVHHTDDESLAFLQYLARYARPASILLVVAGTVHHEAGHPAFATELMRQPTFRRIRLERLTRAEVAALAGSTGCREHASSLYESSGGNPLLLRALLEEHTTTRTAPTSGPRPAGEHHAAGNTRWSTGGLRAAAGTARPVDDHLAATGTARPPHDDRTGADTRWPLGSDRTAATASRATDAPRATADSPWPGNGHRTDGTPPSSPDDNRLAAKGTNRTAAADSPEPLPDPVSAPAPAPEPGGPFVQAVWACLHRAGPTAALVAQAAALLDEAATPERIAELAGIAPPAVRQGLAALQDAGLVTGTRFPHPAVRDAVLSGLSPSALVTLHRGAALLLHRQGRPAAEAAGHLRCAADAAGARWSACAEETELLCDAAESRLAADDGRGALSLLELAHGVCADERQRDAVAIRLARVAWRYDPAAAERLIAGPLAALRSGGLGGEPAQPLAQLLLLQGQITDAAELLRDADAEGAEGAEGEESGASPLDVVIDAGFVAAERLLRSATPTEATMTPIVQALRSLVLSEHPERAVPWSRTLLEDAERRDAPGWAAVFATLHAQALLRIGGLTEACAYASRALDALPERTGGAFPYAATAVLIRAHSAMGHYTEASRLCDRPLHRGLLDSLHGLAFLHARGLHHLTGNQPQAALTDFLTIGRIMQGRGVDRPACLPWRSDAAQALLRLGKPQQAERLVLQQLALPDARRPWVRGVSLHQRALIVTSVRQRVSLLEQAVDELHRSGDRLATARAMADLGRTRQAETGASMKGTATIRAAWNLAKECGATALCKEILPDAPLSEQVQDRAADRTGAERPESRLSSSEQRVATLAAQGLTNREISAKLYLTVSTVEQHLTKVYRKLQINGRGDLPIDLALGDGPAPAGRLVRGD